MEITVLKPEDVSAKVFQYGIRINKESLPVAKEQFWLYGRAYNDIIAMMRDTASTAISFLEEKSGPDIFGLKECIALERELYRAAKAADNRSALEEIAPRLKKLWSDYRTILHATRKQHKEDVKQLLYDTNNNSVSQSFSIWDPHKQRIFTCSKRAVLVTP